MGVLLSGVLLSGVLAAADARAAGVKVGYGISLAGLPIGEADLAAQVDGERYRTEVRVRFTGLAGAVTGGRAAATASGTVAGGRTVPGAFSISSASSSASRTIRLGLERGNVTAVEINPPLENAGDRVPVTEAHRRGIVDPVSALVMPAPARVDLTDPGLCERTLPVFDGGARFDVVLSYGGTRQASLGGYNGPVLVCNARYVPVAGHRPDRPGTRFMAENRDMNVWLAPVPGERVLVPLRIQVATTTGTSVIEATRWAPEGGSSGGQASRGGAPAR